MLTRKQRKERQNLLVKFGVPRHKVRRLRSQFEFVQVYNDIIDAAIENPKDATEELLSFLAKQIESGEQGITVDDSGEKVDEG